ncbi:MAG: DHH family phosphoesterase [Cyanobium sp. MAG06]|nr:DHH family phosphoesterase [Cyanobium sp. MAG06]
MTNDKIIELYNNFFKNRNIDEEERERFITPDYKRDILDPFIFIDMDKAVKRLKSAIDNKEKILIYTDYDCDGIPAGTILYDFFKKINYNNFENYIPHRHKEGYGLHKAVIEKYIKNGYTLMITADLGITNVEEVKYSEENGMNVILTDHHLPLHKVENINGEERKSEILPPAYTILNVQLQREKYINKGLCGCGTAWKLICGFLSKYREEYSVVEGYEK